VSLPTCCSAALIRGARCFHPPELLLQRADPFSQGTESLQLRDRSVGVLDQAFEVGVLRLQPFGQLAQFGQVIGGTTPAKITEKGGHQALLLDGCRARLEGAGSWPARVSIVGRVESPR
jgi:hypothetical protein